MYRLRRSVIAAASLLLAGCAGVGGNTKPLDKEFTCQISVTGEKEFKAELERAENSGWRVTLKEPQSAKGTELCYLADGKVTLELEGHTIVYTRDDIPDAGVFDLITSAADMCIESKGVTSEPSGDRMSTHGEVRGLSFTAFSENGSLTSIEIGGDIKAEFVMLPEAAAAS